MKKFVKIASLFALLAVCFSMAGCDVIQSIIPGAGNVTTVEDFADSEYVAADMTFVKQSVKSGTISANMTLPTEGQNGSTIAWKSSNEAVIGNDGTLPALSNGGLTADGKVPTATLTGTVTYGSASETYEVEVTVDRRSDDAKAVLVAIAALENQYLSKTLSGYRIDKDEAGKTVYALEFLTRTEETVEYASSAHLTFNGNVAVVTPASAEECGTNSYITENLNVTIKRGDVTVAIAIPLQIEGDNVQVVSMQQLREAMAADGWADANNKTTTYLVSGTVTLVWENNGSYEGFYMQDNGYGLYVYSASIGSSIDEVQEGDEIFLTATMTIYSGLVETSSVSAVQVYKKAADNQDKIAKETPFVITAENFNTAAMLYKDGACASVEELIYISGTMTSGTSANNLIFRIPGTTTNITATCGKYTTDFSSIMSFINGLKAGDLVSFEKVAIGRYKENYQITLSNAKYLSKLDKELADADKIALSKEFTKLSPVSAALSGLTYDLPEGEFGTTVEWSVKELGSKASIVDGKLVMGSFEENFTFTLVATIVAGELKEELGEYTVSAVKLDTLEEVLAAAQAGTFSTKKTVKFYVVDSIGDGKVVATADYKTFVIIKMADAVSNTEVIADITEATYEGGQYKLAATAPMSSTTTGVYLGTSVLGTDLNKRIITNVTVADGVATLGGSNITLYTDATLSTKLASGTYDYLTGYVYSADETTINVVVTNSSMVSLATVNAMDASQGGNVTVVGLVCAVSSSGAVVLIDENGDVVNVYVKDSTIRATITHNTYVIVSGTVSLNYDVLQIADVTAVTPVVGTLSYTIETAAAKAVKNLSAEEITADNGIRSLRVIKGTYNTSETDKYNNIYIDIEGATVKCLNNSKYFGQTSVFNAAKAKLDAIKDNASQYEVTVVVIDNVYVSSGNTLVQCYPIWETLTVTAKA